jgi:NADH dehydrogenase (ubiquinone) Fe-S protein 3
MKYTNLTSMVGIIPVFSSFPSSDEKALTVSHKDLLFSLYCLKTHINYQYKLLSCITGVDLIDCKYRFGVVYDILSLTYSSRLRVKVFVNEITSVDSVIDIYVNSDWWEREIWDMYGIYFNNHPDLRRILTDYGFEGYPMRKDFPLSGYVELKYDESKKRIVLEPLELSQEFRSFTFEMPW